MKAMVCGGPGNKSWTDVPDPAMLNSGDAIVQVDPASETVDVMTS
jgi:alcohol dehydrogenase